MSVSTRITILLGLFLEYGSYYFSIAQNMLDKYQHSKSHLKPPIIKPQIQHTITVKSAIQGRATLVIGLTAFKQCFCMIPLDLQIKSKVLCFAQSSVTSQNSMFEIACILFPKDSIPLVSKHLPLRYQFQYLITIY